MFYLYYKRNIKTRLVHLWCDNALGECCENNREACKTHGYASCLHASLVFSQHSLRALSHYKRTRIVFDFLINTSIFKTNLPSLTSETRFTPIFYSICFAFIFLESFQNSQNLAKMKYICKNSSNQEMFAISLS